MRRFLVPALIALGVVVLVASTVAATVLLLDDDGGGASDERATICVDVRRMVAAMRGNPTDPRWTVAIDGLAGNAADAGDDDLTDALGTWGAAHLTRDFTGAGNATRDVAELCEEVT